jgi:3-hydroxyacyl-[acyl-carrier-protein] dehydratase
MLKGDLYQIIKQTESQSYRYRLRLNAGHDIFKGHFPGLPVLPGVCMMAMVREILEEITGKSLVMERTTSMKFLSLINPIQCPEPEIEIKFIESEGGTITADAVISDANITYFKMIKAVYR